MLVRGISAPRGAAWIMLSCAALCGCNVVEPASGGADPLQASGLPPTSAPASNPPAAPALAPVVGNEPPTSVQAGALYDYTPEATDPQGGALMFDASNLPDWVSFTPATGEIRGTPSEGDIGTSAEIQIGVANVAARVMIGPFRITVTPPPSAPNPAPPSNSPPEISGNPATSIIAGQSYEFTPQAVDADADTMTFSIVNRPSWARFNTNTGELTGTPTSADLGTTSRIVISVSDGSATSALPPFSLQVQAAANHAPSITGTPPTSVTAGSSYSFRPVASDPDGHKLTFSVQHLPGWASFTSATGQLSGRPMTQNVGIFQGIVISVSDGAASVSLAPFSIQVRAAASAAPVLSGSPPTTAHAGSAYLFTPGASDPAGRTLTFSIHNAPSWTVFNTGTGQLSGTPSSREVGTYPDIRIGATDGEGSASLAPFAIEVQAALEHAPVISGNPSPTVEAGSTYRFRPSATDPDGGPLRFSVQNAPSWASFSPSTGQLSGIPSANQVGTYANIVITVSDGSLKSSLTGFSIAVQAPADRGPDISGTPSRTVRVGADYSFKPAATDPDSTATLTFSIRNLPAWAHFNSRTGELTGSPTAANIAQFSNIIISVSDGQLTASLPAFAITVTEATASPVPPDPSPGNPPSPSGPPLTIGGTPVTSVNVGAPYSFMPMTADTGTVALTFSVRNLPRWASFDAASGELSGTPAAEDVGSYPNILVSVSDGTYQASLPAFTVQVTQAANGSATLSWTAPTRNTDGSPLVNLAGFHIYYGTSASNLDHTITVANPGLPVYVLGNLSPATWYFGVKAYSSAGVESNFSNTASKTIR